MSFELVLKCSGGCSSVVSLPILPLFIRIASNSVSNCMEHVASEARCQGWRKRGDKYYCRQCFRFKRGDTVASTRNPRPGAIGKVIRVARNRSWVDVHWNTITLPPRMLTEHLLLVEEP